MLLLRDKVDNYKLQNLTSFSEEEYKQAKEKYLELLCNWDKEYLDKADKNKPQYYESERCLKTRLREYADDHLRFLTDFRIDFTNNLAERGLRPAKTKLKVIGCFKSLKYAKLYSNAISIIDTCKKQKVDIGTTVESIFRGNKKVFTF